MCAEGLTSPTAMASCLLSGLASSTNLETLEYPVSPVDGAPFSDVKTVKRDMSDVEGAGDGVEEGSDGVERFSFDLAGVAEEL